MSNKITVYVAIRQGPTREYPDLDTIALSRKSSKEKALRIAKQRPLWDQVNPIVRFVRCTLGPDSPARALVQE